MRKFFIPIALAAGLCLTGCEDQQTKQELEKLRGEIVQKDEQIAAMSKRLAAAEEELTKAQKLIKDTIEAPETRFKEIQEHIDAGRYEQVTSLLAQYLSEFPTSRHATKAKELQEKLPQMIADQKKAAEEKAQMLRDGFEKITVYPMFTCLNGTKIVSKNFKSGKTFICDRYDSQYHYATADKDKVYITGNIDIISKDSNPLLPAIMVGKVSKEGKLVYIKLMHYEMYQWESYGSYLGNYSDNGNDFSKTDTVKFSVGVEVLKEKGTYIIFTAGEPYFERRYDRFRNPPIYYIMDLTKPVPIPVPDLSLEDFLDKYKALAVIRR